MIIAGVWSSPLQMYVNEAAKFVMCYFGEGTSLILTSRPLPAISQKIQTFNLPSYAQQ